MTYRVLDLFSGIGGFSLGLERTGGFETVAFCEIEPFCQKVLAKHWPGVPIYDDVRTLTADRLRTDGIVPDVICGGFPCQDISVAGKGAGLAGERSGLWSEYARIIGELGPRYVIVENVSALLGRGLDKVLGDLAEIGFDAEWHCIPASAVGAPHRRDRIWIIGGRLDADATEGGTGEILRALRDEVRTQDIQWPTGGFGRLQTAEVLLNQVCVYEGAPRPLGHVSLASSETSGTTMRGLWFDGSVACPSCRRTADEQRSRKHPDTLRVLSQLLACDCGSAWLDPAGTPTVSSRVDRLRALGNAVVPQIPELIGNAILAADRQKEAA